MKKKAVKEFKITKILRASSLIEALKLEKRAEITEIETREIKGQDLTPAIGFTVDRDETF